jgi:hypothetical protein
MDPLTYRIIHLIGLAALAIGAGGMMASNENKRTFASVQGLGLLLILVSGFGILAKLHLGFPHFAIVKLVLWIVIGMLPMVFRRTKTPLIAALLIILVLIGAAAWLGVMKPALW